MRHLFLLTYSVVNLTCVDAGLGGRDKPPVVGQAAQVSKEDMLKKTHMFMFPAEESLNNCHEAYNVN